jgi:hypothetical protein
MEIHELRRARIARDWVIDNPSTPLEKAQAHADFYAAIHRANRSGLTSQEIQTAAMLSRQRVWEILRTTTVQLPREDV